MRYLIHQAALLGAATLAACGGGGGDSAPTRPGACSHVSVALCTEYSQLADAAREQSACLASGGAWVAACPAANRVGTCAGVAAPGATMDQVYYPGWGPPATLAAGCAGRGGTWIAGPGTEGTPTQQAFSCDARPAGPCSDVDGLMSPEARSVLEGLCWLGGDAVLAPGTACPTAGRTGTCTVPFRTDVTSHDRYYDAATAAADEAACGADGGTWTPN